MLLADKLTSSNALGPLTTIFGRNLVIGTGLGSSLFSAAKDALVVIMYGAKSPNDTFKEMQENSLKNNNNSNYSLLDTTGYPV